MKNSGRFLREKPAATVTLPGQIDNEIPNVAEILQILPGQQFYWRRRLFFFNMRNTSQIHVPHPLFYIQKMFPILSLFQKKI